MTNKFPARAVPIAALLWLAVATLAGPALAQSYLVSPSAGTLRPSGFQLYSVSTYYGYTWLNIPPDVTLNPDLKDLTYQHTAGVTATFGLGHQGPAWNFNIVYSPYMYYQNRYGWRNFNHHLTLNASRKITPNLVWTLSGTGIMGDFNQFLYTPTQYSTVTSAPTTFTGLTDAVLSGKFTNDQLASILTGAPVVDQAAQRYFFFDRLATAALSTSLNWSVTPRLAVTGGVQAHATKRLTDNRPGASNAPNLLLRSTVSEGAYVNLSYQLTPRTTAGLNATTNYVASNFQHAFNNAVAATLGRKLSTRWFGQIQAGAGRIVLISSRGQAPPQNIQAVGGATLGYHTTAHALIGTYNRTIGDSYGAGAGHSQVVSGAWTWSPRQSNWGFQLQYNAQILTGQGLQGPVDVIGHRINAGISRRLTNQSMGSFQYVYARNTLGEGFGPSANNGFGTNGIVGVFGGSGIVTQGVRVTVTWSPRSGFFDGTGTGGSGVPPIPGGNN